MAVLTRNSTKNPMVSVLLPNLNTRRFLVERLDSILGQTLTNWELIIVDSYSDDGAWELIQEYAARDSRFRISQAPRDGIYPNLNRCIEQARGEYLYIATSDDTMTPECLETMVAALNAHPECDLCHTRLQVIDEQGAEIAHFAERLRPAQFYGDLLKKTHIRFAPYDGILHGALYTIYTSLTQLLMRHSVFEKIGMFRTDCGAEADFEWGMRIGLLCNTLHLPLTLATWRVHKQQATQHDDATSPDKRKRLCRMIRLAVNEYQQRSLNALPPRFSLRRLLFPYRREYFRFSMREHRSCLKKIMFALIFFFISPRSVRDFFLLRFGGHAWYVDDLAYIRRELARLGLASHIKILEE